MQELTATAAALSQLAHRLDALRQAARDGDRLPRAYQPPTPAQQAARDALHRAERWDARVMASQGRAPIGASPAPVDIGILDVIRDIEIDLAELERAIAARVAPTMAPPGRHGTIRRIGDLLSLASLVPDLADHVHAEIVRMSWRAAAALGDLQPLTRITTQRCPVCGSLSLRYDEDRDHVACYNPACRCNDWLCGCDEGRRHIWTPTELRTLINTERHAS